MHLIAGATVWYAARAGGVVSYLLVTAALLAGIGLAGKLHVPGFPRFAVEDIHRFLGLLAAVFITIHVTGILLDTTVPFSIRQVLVPFTASYRPLWTGLGVVALELLVALAITNRFRARLPYRFWRRAHYASFAVWLAASVHGFMSGTDRDQAWLIMIYAVAAGSVGALLVLRLDRTAEAAARPPARLRPPGEVAERSNAAVSKTVTGR